MRPRASLPAICSSRCSRLNPVTTLPEPRLAEKWDLAPDNKTITFHLHHDVKWFDGQPVTARDVLFTLDVIYDPKVPNSIRPAITIDKKRIEAEAPDDYTVVMHLPKPFAPLLYSIGITVMPAHLLEADMEGRKLQPYVGDQHRARTSSSATARTK